MDLEQLKLILETIQSMGGDAKEFGIWWLVCTQAPGMLSSVLLFVFGVISARWLYLAITAGVRAMNVSWEIATMLDLHPGAYWNTDDTKAVRQRIHRLQEIEKNWKDT